VPIYEFRCKACRRRSSVFVRSATAAVAPPNCEHCGSKKTERIFSRVAVHRGLDGMEGAESGLGDVDESDPRSVARWVRKMSQDMGEPLDADQQSELERMESGEMSDDDAGLADDDFSALD
jgi:putative FmdB family regulatory protein